MPALWAEGGLAAIRARGGLRGAAGAGGRDEPKVSLQAMQWTGSGYYGADPKATLGAD